MGHARALLALESADDQLQLREIVIKKKLSVRETERKVNEIIRSKNKPITESNPSADVHLKALEDDLRRIYGVGVRIMGNDAHGLIQFTYGTREDLMQLADKLKGQNVSTPN